MTFRQLRAKLDAIDPDWRTNWTLYDTALEIADILEAAFGDDIDRLPHAKRLAKRV